MVTRVCCDFNVRSAKVLFMVQGTRGYGTKSTYVLEYCGRRASNVMSDRRAAFDAAKKTRTGAKLWVSQSVKEAEELRNQLESSVEVSKSEYAEKLKSLSTRLNAWRKAQADVEFLSFFPLAIKQWNTLPSSIASEGTLPLFQDALSSHSF